MNKQATFKFVLAKAKQIVYAKISAHEGMLTKEFEKERAAKYPRPVVKCIPGYYEDQYRLVDVKDKPKISKYFKAIDTLDKKYQKKKEAYRTSIHAVVDKFETDSYLSVPGTDDMKKFLNKLESM